MAEAPRPGGAGTTGGKAKVAAARARITITVHHPDREDVTRSFRPNMVPFKERLIVRKAVGMPFEAFLPDEHGIGVGIDTVQVWWFIASRAQDPMTTLDKALADWPEVIDADTFDIVEDDGNDPSDPEA